MTDLLENKLDEYFDWIIDQLTKGNTIDGLKRNRFYSEFEQVKEWKSKFGFQLQIYSNDHFINNKPHFHLVKKSEDIDCRIFFDGIIHDYKGRGHLDKRTKAAIDYFLSNPMIKERLKELWNIKNPCFEI
jgi:hypothetical protein